MNAREFAQQFESRFGRRPRIFRAPGRVNLIGEHTDYNDGFVMPAAVGFSTYVAISGRPDSRLLIDSQEFPGHFEFGLDQLPAHRVGAWCDYVLGVASVLRQRGLNLYGSNILVHGEVPVGAGLSSSAAIEVASAFAFMSLDGQRLPLPEIAKLCRRAENLSVPVSASWISSFPAWEKPGTRSCSTAVRWNSSSYRFRRAFVWWSATRK